MRYFGLTANDRKEMLAQIGVTDIDTLFANIPSDIYLKKPIETLPLGQGELAVERHMVRLAAMNLAAGQVPFFIGAGAYRHHVPAAVDHLIQRSEFLTSYTPYQPEISQGTLQYLFEFQTQVALLTGMEVANASMYDGSTAASEAVLMAQRVTKRRKVIISGNVHPQYVGVIETNQKYMDAPIITQHPAPKGDEDLLPQIDKNTAAVVVQYPDFFGHIQDFTALGRKTAEVGALLIVVVTEIVALGAITPPGAMGADIVVAEGQSLGNGLNYGGPYLGLFATRSKFVRQMPGRLCGQTVDADGKRGFVLTLNTREQHIRREKATSNICTNAGLCALAFTIHLSLLGEVGLKQLAMLNHMMTVQTADALAKLPGAKVLNKSFFNEICVDLGAPAAPIVEKLAARKILVGLPVSRLSPDNPDLKNLLLVAVTETTPPDDIHRLYVALRECLS